MRADLSFRALMRKGAGHCTFYELKRDHSIKQLSPETAQLTPRPEGQSALHCQFAGMLPYSGDNDVSYQFGKPCY